MNHQNDRKYPKSILLYSTSSSPINDKDNICVTLSK